MASEKPERVIKMQEFGRQLARCRTESKKALLKAIKDAGGNW